MRDPVAFCLIAALCAAAPSAIAGPLESDSYAVPPERGRAATMRQVSVTTVRFGDLDLSRKADRKTLAARVNDAAETVCGPRPSRGETLQRRDYTACRRDAVRMAMASVPKAEALASESGSRP